MPKQLDSDGTGSPIASALAHWKLILAGTALGATLGGATGFALPTSYEAEARLAVGAGSSSAYAIAGYPVAARDLAQNYSRWVQNNAVDGTWSYPGVTDVSATPIPESGVIRIETAAPDSQTAVQAAAHVSDRLLETVAEVEADQDVETALEQYRERTPAVAAAQANASLAESAFGRSPTAANARAVAAARNDLAEANLLRDALGDRYRRLAANPSSVSQLTSIAPAAATGDNAARNVGLGVGAGAGLGLIIAFVAGALADTRRGRAGGSGQSPPADDGANMIRTPRHRRPERPTSTSAGNRRSHAEQADQEVASTPTVTSESP